MTPKCGHTLCPAGKGPHTLPPPMSQILKLDRHSRAPQMELESVCPVLGLIRGLAFDGEFYVDFGDQFPLKAQVFLGQWMRVQPPIRESQGNPLSST